MFRVGDKVLITRGRYSGEVGHVAELDPSLTNGLWVSLPHGDYYCFTEGIRLMQRQDNKPLPLPG